MKKVMLSAAALMVFFAACNKSDDNNATRQEMLVGTWNLTEFGVDANQNGSIDAGETGAASTLGMTMATTLNSACSQHNHPQFNSAEIAITVIDSRQARLQRIISKIMSDLNEKSNEYYHLNYEAITLSSETAKMIGLDIGERKSIHMSGRTGIQVDADFVLDKLHEKAYDGKAGSRRCNYRFTRAGYCRCT